MSPRLSDLFLRSQSDERLVGLAREGHERAFAVIVERYGRELLAVARRLGSDGRAEDLVQQTFLSAFAALGSGVEVTHLRGWLYRILRNATISASKRPHAEPGLEPETVGSEPLEDTVERRMLAREVLAEVASLPGRQRDALVATVLHGRSREAVATSMGVSEGAVRQLMHRARATLRTSVTAVTPWPLARWLATARSGSAGDRLSEIAVGAGTASAGGVAVKLGAVVVSGVVATGIVSTQLPGHHPSRRGGPGVPSAHSSRPPGGGASSAAAARMSAAVGLPVFGSTAITEKRSQRASGSDGEGSRPGSGDHSAGTEGGGSMGGPGAGGRDGSGTSSSGSGDGGGSSGGSDGGGDGGQSASTNGSSSDGGSSTASKGSDGGTMATTSTTSTSGSHDGGGGSGSGDAASASNSGSGDGGGGQALSLSGDSGSSGISGSSEDPGLNTTSGSSPASGSTGG